MIKSLLSGLTIGSVGTLLAMQYHLVRTDERIVIVSRVHQPPLRSAYVDIRHWSVGMWEHYPELREAMIKAGRQDLLAERQPAVKSSGDDSAVPFHDVSKSVATPILNATEARTPAPVSTKAAMIKQDQQQAANETPIIALGTPRSISSPASTPAAQPAPEQTLIRKDITAAESQRSVPNPIEMQPLAPQTVPAPATKLSSGPAEAGEAPQRDWVQHLLKSFVPGKETISSPRPAAAVPAVELPAEAIPEPQDAPGEGESSFPASPRRIPVAQANQI